MKPRKVPTSTFARVSLMYEGVEEGPTHAFTHSTYPASKTSRWLIIGLVETVAVQMSWSDVV